MATSRLDVYKEKLKYLELQRNKLMRAGKYIQMNKLNEDIIRVKELIAEAEEFEARPLKEFISEQQLHESGIIPLIMECYLAADFLNDCVFELKSRVDAMGLQAVTLMPEIKDILKKTQDFASILCTKDQDLRDLMLDDDTLIAAIHKKMLSYIGQRMKKSVKK